LAVRRNAINGAKDQSNQNEFVPRHTSQVNQRRVVVIV